MNRFRICLAVCLTVLLGGAVANARTKLRVTGDRVNLRALADSTSEIVGQVSTGDILMADSADGEWFAVSPPSETDVWVYRELVVDGVVAVTKLRVRSGPGISYRPVGRVTRGDRVEERGVQGDWLKIAPPPDCTVYIHRDFVERADAPPAAPPEAARPQPAPTPSPRPQPAPAARPAAPPPAAGSDPVRPPPVRVTPPPVAAPSRVEPRRPPPPTVSPAPSRRPPMRRPDALQPDRLVDTRVQGVGAEVEGVLRRAVFVWRRPSRYRLVKYDAAGRAVTKYYVVGRDAELAAALDRRVRIEGETYWVQGARYPVLLAENLTAAETVP